MEPVGLSCDLASQHDATLLLLPYALGWGAHAILYGSVASGFATYYASDHYLGERPWVKGTLWSVFVLESANIVLNVGEIGVWCTTQQRSREKLYDFLLIDVLALVPAIFITCIVQTYLLQRAQHFITSRPRQRLFNIVCGTMIVLGCLANLMVAVIGFLQYTDNADALLPWTINRMTSVSLWITATCDTTIAVTLWWSLRSRLAGFNQTTDRQLVYLGRLAMQSGAFTSFFAVTGAVLSAVYASDTSDYATLCIAFWCPLPALYMMSLLHTLNGRKAVSSMAQQATKQAPTNLQPGFKGGSVFIPSARPRTRIDDDDQDDLGSGPPVVVLLDQSADGATSSHSGSTSRKPESQDV